MPSFKQNHLTTSSSAAFFQYLQGKQLKNTHRFFQYMPDLLDFVSWPSSFTFPAGNTTAGMSMIA
jgi:hypothetical protein